MSGLGYVLDDPRPIAAEAPYTYFLPSFEELEALAEGDLVQLVFRPVPAREKWGAERMWVTIVAVSGDALTGRLDSDPDDMPCLRPGDLVEFLPYNAIDCIWSETRSEPPPAQVKVRSYWERCLVDRCVVDDHVPVHFLYREEPELAAEGDKYPDSGWRIRGDYRSLSDEEIQARETSYIAIGPVLNADDSWLHLIDSPVGSAFIRDWETGEFGPEDG
jgi:hypothetical protein